VVIFKFSRVDDVFEIVIEWGYFFDLRFHRQEKRTTVLQGHFRWYFSCEVWCAAFLGDSLWYWVDVHFAVVVHMGWFPRLRMI